MWHLKPPEDSSLKKRDADGTNTQDLGTGGVLGGLAECLKLTTGTAPQAGGMQQRPSHTIAAYHTIAAVLREDRKGMKKERKKIVGDPGPPGAGRLRGLAKVKPSQTRV